MFFLSLIFVNGLREKLELVDVRLQLCNIGLMSIKRLPSLKDNISCDAL